MPLIDANNKVINVQAEGGWLPTATGDDNLGLLKRIIARMSVSTNRDLNHRGTIYFPPGRYPIARDTTLDIDWEVNFRGHLRGEQAGLDGRYQRRFLNPFKVSFVFPPGITLWLAPGAVLVPAAGCVIDIGSLLICEATQCFDLVDEGLVIFGNATPTVRPEWWGGPNDSTRALRRAIAAAILDRGICWPSFDSPDGRGGRSLGAQTLRRRPLEVELGGRYVVEGTIDVHGDDTRNGILDQLDRGSGRSLVASSGAYVLPSDTATIIRGSWSGARRQGASLIAGGGLGLNPMLRLTATPGITLQNIAFSTMAPGFQPSVEIQVSTRVLTEPAPAAQNISLRSCHFEGPSTPLVQIGARQVRREPDAQSIYPYTEPDNEIGADFCLLSFEDCGFQVRSDGVGIDVRASQSLPLRFRRCDFAGSAAAFMSLWSATYLLEGCRFRNDRAASSPTALPVNDPLRGYESPDGSDLFLRRDLAIPIYNERTGLSPIGRFIYDLLPGIVALGCVSHSQRFLSAAATIENEQESQEWPILLVNLRQSYPAPRVAAAIRWGLQNVHSAIVSGDRRVRPMAAKAALVVIGGTVSSELQILRGATQCAVVGLRVRDVVEPGDGALGITFEYVRKSPFSPTLVFGLPADQHLRGVP